MAGGGFDRRNIGSTFRDYPGKITLYHIRVTCLVVALGCWFFEYDPIGISGNALTDMINSFILIIMLIAFVFHVLDDFLLYVRT